MNNVGLILSLILMGLCGLGYVAGVNWLLIPMLFCLFFAFLFLVKMGGRNDE